MLRILIAAAVTVFAVGQPYVAAEPPNFIVILADDLGYADLGCFGAVDMDTPCLDRMASEGMRLIDFHVSAPTCTASRASLLTGCYPVRIGMGDAIAPRADGTISPSRVLWPNSPYGLNPNEVTIAEVVKEVGYATGVIGKWHVGDRPEFNPTRQGFDEFFGVLHSNDMEPYVYYRGMEPLDESIDRDRQTQRYTSEALDFIRRRKDEPFFLYVAHTMPHVPLAASEAFRGKSKRGLYGDAVSEVDWSVGQILDELRKLKLDRRTLVIFSSDNGGWLARGEDGGLNTPLRGGKGCTYEGGMCVPAIAWQPSVVPDGAVCDELTSTMDLLPTLAAMAGGTPPGDRKIDGHDISPLLRGQPGAKSPWKKFFFYFGNELHGVRSGKWKLRAKNMLKNENIYNRKWRESDIGKIAIPAALYDLSRDPAEQKSVLRQHPKVAARLKRYMDEARADLGDSLQGMAPRGDRPVGKVE